MEGCFQNILVVSGSKKNGEAICRFFPDKNTFITMADNRKDALETALTMDIDGVIINTPIMGEFGDTLAILLAQKTMAGILLLAEKSASEKVSSQLGDLGVAVLSKPLSKDMFLQTVRMLTASKKRYEQFRTENSELQSRLDELGLISRAKCILMEYLRMSEEQAHKYIEKQSMDMRCSKKAVAESILNTYES